MGDHDRVRGVTLNTWQRNEFRITIHDAGRKLTALDFDLARDIDRVAEASGATSVDAAGPNATEQEAAR